MSSNGSPSVSTVRELLHAVRNSLSLISGYTQYLLLKTAPGQAPAPELRIICRETERAVSLLNLVPEPFADLALPTAASADPPRGPDPDRPPTV
jgi:nitrogen-specific signal transduction histidine kinase